MATESRADFLTSMADELAVGAAYGPVVLPQFRGVPKKEFTFYATGAGFVRKVSWWEARTLGRMLAERAFGSGNGWKYAPPQTRQFHDAVRADPRLREAVSHYNVHCRELIEKADGEIFVYPSPVSAGADGVSSVRGVRIRVENPDLYDSLAVLAKAGLFEDGVEAWRGKVVFYESGKPEERHLCGKAAMKAGLGLGRKSDWALSAYGFPPHVADDDTIVALTEVDRQPAEA